MIAITFVSALFDAWYSFPLPPLLEISTNVVYAIFAVAVAASLIPVA